MSRKLGIILFCLVALSATSTLHYLFGMFLPYLRTSSQGNLRWASDFQPRWEGTRAVFLEAIDPFSDVVTNRIQIWFYGSPLPPGSRLDTRRFAYPGHTVLLLAPFGLMTFQRARMVMTIVLFICTAGSLAMWVRMAGIPNHIRLFLVLLACSGWPFVEALYLGQPTLLVLFFLSAAVYLSWKGRFTSAGILLALATIKPQLVLACIASLLSWAWFQKSGRKMACSFGISCALMFGMSEWLIPGWVSEWVQNAHEYINYTGSLTSFQCIFGKTAGLLLTFVCVLLVAYRFRNICRVTQNSDEFQYFMAVIFAVTMIIVPRSQWRTYDEVILFPSFVYLCVRLREFKDENAVTGVIHLSALVLVVWPNLATIVLTARHLLGATFDTQSSLAPPTYSIFLVAPTVLLSLLILKVRHKQNAAEYKSDHPAIPSQVAG